jgi:L-rhamnose mutarotase
MSNSWDIRQVRLRYQLSDKTLFSKTFTLSVRTIGLTENEVVTDFPEPPQVPLQDHIDGFLIQSLPVAKEQPRIRWYADLIVYVPYQYSHCYINLQQSFEDYMAKFSSKSRSTIKRKIRKFAKYCEGTIEWRSYRTDEELRVFHKLGRQVSVKTYQEKLLDAGLPDSKEFYEKMVDLAKSDNVRGYLIFYHGNPIAYLYCPVEDGVMLYEYLGYDPEYQKWSVGTILQWLALEEIFAEERFKIFDFTEGQDPQKKLLATDSVQSADVFFIRHNLKNIAYILLHIGFEEVSKVSGKLLDRIRLKKRIKQLIRFGFKKR